MAWSSLSLSGLKTANAAMLFSFAEDVDERARDRLRGLVFFAGLDLLRCAACFVLAADLFFVLPAMGRENILSHHVPL